jgi:hypothetical protein
MITLDHVSLFVKSVSMSQVNPVNREWFKDEMWRFHSAIMENAMRLGRVRQRAAGVLLNRHANHGQSQWNFDFVTAAACGGNP